MTTPAVTPVISTTTWLKTHERLIIVALVLLAGYFGLNHYLNNAAARSETRATVAEAALSAQQSQNAVLASQSAQVAQQYQAMVSALTAQNASLAALAASRQATVVKNQATDATLAPSALADRLKTLGNAPDGSVSTSGTGVELTNQGAVAVTQTLETLPALQADLKDETTLAQAAQAARTQADTVIADQGTQITGLNLAITDQTKACTDQIKAVKAEARKSKLAWFKRGFITGFISGIFVGHAAGL